MIGYLDHTNPKQSFDVIKTAYLLGATIIKKHYTLDKTLKGNEFINMIRGSGELKCLESEKVARQNARRSIVSRGDIPKGTVITPEMLTYKRPGTGIAPLTD